MNDKLLQSEAEIYIETYMKAFKSKPGYSRQYRKKYARGQAAKSSKLIAEMMTLWSKRNFAKLPYNEDGKWLRKNVSSKLTTAINRAIQDEAKELGAKGLIKAEVEAEIKPPRQSDETKNNSIASRIIAYFRDNDTLPLSRKQLSLLMDCTDQAFDYPMATIRKIYGIEVNYDGDGWKVVKRKPIKTEKHLAMEKALGKEFTVENYEALRDLLKDLV